MPLQEGVAVGMTGAPFSISFAGDGDRRVLVLLGELDLSSAPQLEAALESVCGDGAQEVFVDVSRLDFMDTSGLRAILLGERVCAEHGCEYFVDPALPGSLLHLVGDKQEG